MLRNTEHVYGIVILTGHESKVIEHGSRQRSLPDAVLSWSYSSPVPHLRAHSCSLWCSRVMPARARSFHQSRTLSLIDARLGMKLQTCCPCGASKVMMNATAVPSKRSSLERRLDGLIGVIFCILAALCIVGAVGSVICLNTVTNPVAVSSIAP